MKPASVEFGQVWELDWNGHTETIQYTVISEPYVSDETIGIYKNSLLVEVVESTGLRNTAVVDAMLTSEVWKYIGG